MRCGEFFGTIAEQSGNTIRLDLALLSHLYTVAASAWGMEPLGNPARTNCVRWPKTDTILFDGGQLSGTMTDTVLAG